jgi:hypothetical protein
MLAERCKYDGMPITRTRSFRLDDADDAVLTRYAKLRGLTKTGVLREFIWSLAERMPPQPTRKQGRKGKSR